MSAVEDSCGGTPVYYQPGKGRNNNKIPLKSTNTLRRHRSTVKVSSTAFFLARSKAPHQLALQSEDETLRAVCAHKDLVLL